MKKIITLIGAAFICLSSYSQWGGGFDFGGGGGASSGSLSGYTNKQNIDYVGDNHVGHKLDIYYPNDGKETHNVIIHIYGSAWGSNDGKGGADHGTVGKAALDAGYIFVTPNHRTYNDALWPAQINDIKAVVRYLRGNKEELKIDDSFIGISGFSSGGHLASMMGVTNGETIVTVGSESIDIEGNLGKYTNESSRVDAVCDWSGPVDCRDKFCGSPMNVEPENSMVGGCGPQQCPDKHATLGTNTYIDANDVPHMICHGTTDNIVPSCEGEKYMNNLKKAGVYVEWYNPGHGHQVNGDYTDEMIKFFNGVRENSSEENPGGSTEENPGGSTEENPGGSTEENPGGSAAVVTDPCSKTTSYSGGTRVTGNGIQDIGNGYNYEIWRDGNSGSMTYFGGDADCAFKADWNNSGDFLARVGYYDGAATKKYTDLGEITAAYNYKKSGNGGGSYSYIGIYGWTKSPLIEYYIVDDSFTPNGGGMYYNAQTIGTYQVDGVTYTLKKGTRVNAPSIEGNTTFTQVFAQRSSYQTCGTINVTEHFKNWERLGIQMGGIYDCKILCEVGGGQGSIEYTYATMSWDGQTGAAGGPAEPSEPQGPYDGAIKIPGTVEAENYDKGGNGFGYKDSDNTNEGGEYRKDGVDVVSANGGYAVGYTTSSEWLTYTVNVEKAGKYDVEAFASNGNTDIEIDLFIDDNKVGSVSGAGSEDWDTYVKLTGSVTLPAGEHILKVAFASDYNNLDYIKFYEEGTAPEEEEPSTPSTPSEPSASANGSFFSEDGAYFGPDCGTGAEANYKGAYYTGVYPRVFQDYLGKSDAEVQGKLDQLWNHYFKGNDNSKVYYENGNEAYIYDTGNSDVRSEGMSYGMMICVQTNHRDEFDKLWSFAKNHMWHKGGQWDGYFAWQVGTNGQIKDQNCAPDGELYFMMSLLFAANRWGNDGKHNYMEDAQYILKAMWKGNNGSLFNEQHMVVTFQPYNCSDFSDPSYDLPAFVDLFSRWSTTNKDKWAKAATATRDHLKKSSHSSSGLFTDYNNFDGSPKYVDFNSNAHKYMYDAMRCAMNVGMDYYLFGADAANQTAMMSRLINHFEKNGYRNARFDWDGSNGSESYTLGETGANAVGCFALMDDSANDSKVKTNLKKAWDASLMTGQYRYYDGLVHYLSMLHLCGSFKIWKPQPNIEEKTVEGVGEVTYLGEIYTESTTITAFEDCQLYNVTIDVTPRATTPEENVGNELTENDAEGVKLAPNPSDGNFTIFTSETIETIEILNLMGQIVAVSSDANIKVNLAEGAYFVRILTAEGNSYIEKMVVK